MSFFKFTEDDVFTNTIESYPQYSFYVYSASVYVDSVPHLSGTRDTVSNTIQGVPNGFISLYEYNIDRPAAQRIYPFLYKNGKKDCFKNVSQTDYNTLYYPGDIITSSYCMSASITRKLSAAADTKVAALRNTFNHYTFLSRHYAFSDSQLSFNKATQEINLISIPSVFYGSSIKKGTVSLKYYVTGTLIGELTDSRKNGELVQQGGNGAGNIAGVVLYKEGFIALTGSWALDSAAFDYLGDGNANKNSKWLYFGFGANDGLTMPNDTAHSASFLLEYSGTTHTQTMTMFAHADYGELNHSNNPTFITGSENTIKQFTGKLGSTVYSEPPQKIKNAVSSSFTDEEPVFQKVTYINKIGLYDKNKNLIGVASLATPVRKTEDSDFAFKLKLDI